MGAAPWGMDLPVGRGKQPFWRLEQPEIWLMIADKSALGGKRRPWVIWAFGPWPWGPSIRKTRRSASAAVELDIFPSAPDGMAGPGTGGSDQKESWLRPSSDSRVGTGCITFSLFNQAALARLGSRA